MTVAAATVVRALLAALVLAFAPAANAQVYDHLECYKIKDLAPKQRYTADLLPEQTQFLAQTGCELKVPAKLFCIDVEKSNVVPAPPLVLNGQNTRDYLCYNLKCPPQAELPLQVEDQFGTRTIKVKKKPSQLCAPARKVGFPDPATPTPCLPPSTPTPTASPAATCTDLMQNGGETDVDCGGPCPACMLGEGCGTDSDCQSGICTAGVCTLCSPGQQQSCGTMLPGPCAMGIQTCLMGGMSYSACTGPPPQAETCNGIDDDCNGIVDDSSCPVVPNATGSCNGVSCLYACDAGYADCNGNPFVDGCEVNVQTDNQNCGGCALFCSGTCVAGVCQP